MIPEEADLVRKVFAGYLETHSLVELAGQLNAEGWTTKRWRSKTGRVHGGIRLTPKYLHRVLTNLVYRGRITHTENGTTKSWPGLHEAIIEKKVWDRVQDLMNTQNRQTRHHWTQPFLLKGKLRTGDDFAMSPSSVHRPDGANGRKRLVRYYVSQRAIKHGYRECTVKSVNARHLDELVRALVLDHLGKLSLDQPARLASELRDHWIREIIDSVEVNTERLAVRLDNSKIDECGEQRWGSRDLRDSNAAPTCPYQPEVQDRGSLTILSLAIQIKRLDGRRIILSPEGHDLVFPAEPEPKEHIARAIGMAYAWLEEHLTSRTTMTALARKHGVSRAWVRRILTLTQLGPRVLKAALTGLLPPSITLDDLLAAAQHLDWAKQVESLGLEKRPLPVGWDPRNLEPEPATSAAGSS